MVIATALLAGGIAGVAWPLAAGGALAAVPPHRWLLLVGAALIYWSDSLIANNLFRAPLAHEQLWIMPTYYVGQVAVLLGVLALAGHLGGR